MDPHYPKKLQSASSVNKTQIYSKFEVEIPDPILAGIILIIAGPIGIDNAHEVYISYIEQ